ncbi:MAG: TM0106 family RecB-like putative nuclease [Terriglobia bacterium]
MRLTATDIYHLHQPSVCELRVYLKHRAEPEAEPIEYDKVLQELGARHERNHLQSLGPFEDISIGTLEERTENTKTAVAVAKAVLYQPVLITRCVLGGHDCEVVGNPDFLIPDEEGHLIRDTKISRHADEERHYETVLQLNLYGWLFEQTFGKPPAGLQVVLGDGSVQPIAYDGGASALANLQKILEVKLRGAEPYEPVGWSKCNSCTFFERCWKRADDTDSLARVYGIDDPLARELWRQGIHTVEDLQTKFDAGTLSDFKKPWGKKFQRVGKRSEEILLHASAIKTQKIQFLKKPAVPTAPNLVVFDIEGLPPHLDDLEKIYLWGLQVLGANPEPARMAVASFGPAGDGQGWADFVSHCSDIFVKHGDIPFLHWHHYERVNVQRYIKRFGDPDGVADRVLKNLRDLLPITKDSLVLPTPSYSLKLVEKFAGFKRQLDEGGGQWAMANYIKAVETEDENLRRDLMEKIIAYNKEDLEGTWAVFEWLRQLV